MIGGLGDEQLRTLLSKLLAAEATKRGISAIAISVGGNQTAADAGVDGSINWKGRPAPRDWLPRRKIYFQCKAESMAATALTKEMRPGDIARPILSELAAVGGSYIVFSTDDPTHGAYKNRLKAMRDAVEDVASKDNLHVDFYGADRIARWVNEHLGVALWVLEQHGRSLLGWRPWEPWSAPDSVNRPYVFDETTRAVVDGQDMDVPSAIEVIRETLALPGGSVRLVGISGMGKTRLAEALFDEGIKPTSTLSSNKAIYGDLAQSPAASAAVVAEEILLARVEAVIVLDNTNVTTHAQIAQMVSRPGSKSSVLTIDYDVGGERPIGTIIVELDDNSETVLAAVLKQRCPNLNDAERRHLAEFAGGNARIALKVAESSRKGLDLSTLDDSELVNRLFQSDRQEVDEAARVVADAASLVYAFYVESGDGHEAEHGFLAEIAGISRANFYRRIAMFLDWGVVQQRGPQRAVMPPPLANMLAAPFIRRSEPGWLLAAFANGPARLFASFARRLGQLHNEPAAVRLVNKLFAPAGLLGDPALLDQTGMRAFLHAAPASPDAALAAIERSLAGPSASQLYAASSSERRETTNLLIFISYDPTLFARAIEALLPFALHDHGSGPDEQMRDALLQRFWPMLSFTLADLRIRLAVVDRLLDDERESIQALGLEALDHMLDAWHFSSSYFPDLGAQPRLTEWRPKGRDYRNWVQAALDRLVAASRTIHAPRARAIIAQHVREQAHKKPMRIIAAMHGVRPLGYWEEGWKATSEALHFERDSLPARVRRKMAELEKELRPVSLEECFEAFVVGEPWRHYRPRETERAFSRGVGRLAEAVGKCLITIGRDLAPFLARAVTLTGTCSVWMFGRGLAKRAPDVADLWERAYATFVAAPSSDRDPRLLCGILEGAARRCPEWVDERLDLIVADQNLSAHIVSLHGGITLNARSMARFGAALEAGLAEPTAFSSLHLGGVSKPIPADDLSTFLRKLYAMEKGALTAIQILHMRMYGDRADGTTIDPALVRLGQEFLSDRRTFDVEHQREDFDIAEVAKVALKGEGGRETAVNACRAIRGADGDKHGSWREFDQTCRVIMKLQPRAVFEEIVGTDTNHHLVGRFFGGFMRDDDDLDENQIMFNEQVAMEWVKEDPANRARRLAQFVPYAVHTETGAFAWRSFARGLINLAPDPVSVLNAFGSRFWSGGGSGPISSRFVRRRPLVAEFLNDPDPAKRAWARRASDALEESIRRWSESDKERDTRFE